MIQIQKKFFPGGCYKGFVGFAAPRLMAFPDWDLLSVLTPAGCDANGIANSEYSDQTAPVGAG